MGIGVHNSDLLEAELQTARATCADIDRQLSEIKATDPRAKEKAEALIDRQREAGVRLERAARALEQIKEGHA